MFSVPHVREAVLSAVRQHVGGFRPDPNALMEKLSTVDVEPDDDDPMAALQQALRRSGGAARRHPVARSRVALLPRLDALVALVVGYVDHVVDAVGRRLLGSPGRIAEAVRRRRIEAVAGRRFVERLLGLQPRPPARYERGKAFVAGVVERAGDRAAWPSCTPSADHLPTPAEVDAPGLWLARIGHAD